MALLNAFDGIGLSLSHPFAFFMPVTFGYSGVRVRLLVVRVERLDLLVVGETPVAEAPFQQRGLSPGRRERYALRHLAHGHCDSRSFDRWSSMYLATARSLTEPMLSAK